MFTCQNIEGGVGLKTEVGFLQVIPHLPVGASVPRMLCREVVKVHCGPRARGNHKAIARVSLATRGSEGSRSRTTEHSFGFRPGRSQHQAVQHAMDYIAEGYSWVVDLDLKSFFDTIPHWKMVARCKDRIADERVITILARMLKCGVIQEGRWDPTEEGAPQGGPISPWLSNVVLHQLDMELEARGHRFVRYADDFQVFKSTSRAAYRVRDGLVKFLEQRMHLKVNREKSGSV